MTIRELTRHGEVIIKQEVEALEAFTGFETENRYTVLTAQGETVLHAYEESGTLGRMFMSSHRPLTLHVINPDGTGVLVANRDFFWLFARLRVQDLGGRPIGAVQRRFGFLRRKMAIEDARGEPLAEVHGSMFRPNTFMINRHDEEVAKVTKQWSGVGKEMFTDADTFKLEFLTRSDDEDFLMLVLATAFAVDLDFFEGGGPGGSMSFGE